jgi:hypothetical protein
MRACRDQSGCSDRIVVNCCCSKPLPASWPTLTPTASPPTTSRTGRSARNKWTLWTQRRSRSGWWASTPGARSPAWWWDPRTAPPPIWPPYWAYPGCPPRSKSPWIGPAARPTTRRRRRSTASGSPANFSPPTPGCAYARSTTRSAGARWGHPSCSRSVPASRSSCAGSGCRPRTAGSSPPTSRPARTCCWCATPAPGRWSPRSAGGTASSSAAGPAACRRPSPPRSCRTSTRPMPSTGWSPASPTACAPGPAGPGTGCGRWYSTARPRCPDRWPTSTGTGCVVPAGPRTGSRWSAAGCWTRGRCCAPGWCRTGARTRWRPA